MASQFLETYAENGHAVAAERIPSVLANEGGERNVLQLCTGFRQHGVCELLRTGNPAAFSVATMQSASAYLRFAQGERTEPAALGRAKPLLDAIAGGHLEGARLIAEACADWDWRPELEYREDAIYTQILMALVLGDEASAVSARVEAYAEALDGVRDERLGVFRAIVQADSDAFQRAMADQNRAREAEVDAAVENGILTSETEAWIRPFYLEGVALLRLADRAGLDTGRHHPGAPESVRAASPVPFDPSAWERVPYSATGP